MIEWDSPDKFIGTTAAIVASAIAAGGAIGSSAIAAHASKSAAGQQVDASNKALGVEQQVYEDQKNNLAPYRQAGTDALTRASSLADAGSPIGLKTFTNGNLPQVSLNRQPGAPVSSMPQNAAPPMGLATMGQAQSPQAPAANGGGMVQLRAPNGSMRTVPAAQVAHYLQLGAQVVQ